jgi:hypothetical protein
MNVGFQIIRPKSRPPGDRCEKAGPLKFEKKKVCQIFKIVIENSFLNILGHSLKEF